MTVKRTDGPRSQETAILGGREERGEREMHGVGMCVSEREKVAIITQ